MSNDEEFEFHDFIFEFNEALEAAFEKYKRAIKKKGHSWKDPRVTRMSFLRNMLKAEVLEFILTEDIDETLDILNFCLMIYTRDKRGIAP